MNDLLHLTARAQDTHFWFRGFRRFVAPVIAGIAAGRRDLRLIDCGCGTGANLALLDPFGRVIGFDLTTAVARINAGAHPIVRADITQIPFRSDAFDLATSFDVLQCVVNDEAAIREMARIVKPGGAVLVSVAALEMLRGDHAEVWREVRRYTPGTIRRLVETAGLRVERVSFLFGSLFPLMLGVRTWQRVTRRFRQVRADSDIAVPSAPVNVALTALVNGEAALAPVIRFPIGSSILVVATKPRD